MPATNFTSLQLEQRRGRVLSDRNKLFGNTIGIFN